jgi:DNA processing protein
MVNDIRKLTNQDLPAQLLEIPQPPKHLFVQGSLPSEDAILLTVIGSRKYSNYGKEVCEKFIAGLSGYDIVIVSGLAIGIDSIAHKAALAARLRTIAVPGSGLGSGVLYPSSNRLLAEEIVESGGALISEFEPDFRATPWSFPQRNRIMAGLSKATLVIEAEERSGTLITAHMALDYNKDVFAVPGSLFSQNSRGTNRLLRQGATPITTSNELLEELGFETNKDASGQKKLDLKNCSPEEKQVLEILREPLSRDELIRALEMPINKTNILLSAMEIKGLIKETGGKLRIS